MILDGHIGRLVAAKQWIDLTDQGRKAIHRTSFRSGPRNRKQEKTVTDGMMTEGVTKPANTNWTSHIMFAPKKKRSIRKERSIRFCADYEKLIAGTVVIATVSCKWTIILTPLPTQKSF